MATYNEKLERMRGFIESNFNTAAELVDWLEMDVNDIVRIFPDRLVGHYERVFQLDLEELDSLSDEEELQQWQGWEVNGVFSPTDDFHYE